MSTAVRDHLKENPCISSLTDFKIIGRESIKLLRELKESLFINQLRRYERYAGWFKFDIS